MAKRTTTHNGRGSGKNGFTSKHNDRNFDTTLATHIVPELSIKNQYWCIYPEMTFEAAELKFYEENFSEQLREVNERYIKNRHQDRCKDMEEWKKVRQNAPEESIIQIGKMFDDKGNRIADFVPGPQLLEVYREFCAFEEAWNEAHGRPFTVLNEALHMDEPNSADHIQRRRVWHFRANDGTLHVGQERALEAAGIDLPHPEKKEGRYNNRKIVFDKIMREKWLDLCQEHGIDVERQPVPGRKKSKDLETFIREKNEALINENAVLQDKIDSALQDAAIADSQRKIAVEAAASASQEAEKARKEAQEAQEQAARLKADVGAVTAELAAKTAALDAISPIKTMEEYQAVAAAATAELDELEETMHELNDQFEEAEERYGSSKIAFDDIKWLFQQKFLPKVMQLIDSVKEKMQHMAIFEAFKGIKEKLSVTLGSRLKNAQKAAQELPGTSNPSRGEYDYGEK